MLKALGHQLGTQKFKPEADMAWDKALRVLFQVITDINDEKKCICPPPSRAQHAPTDPNAAGTSKKSK